MTITHRLRPTLASSAFIALAALAGCAAGPISERAAPPDHKAQVVAVLKSFETGDAKARDVISDTLYIQHNLGVGDGRAALEARLAGRPVGSTTVSTVRVLQDGDYVVAHSVYGFSGNARIGMDIFRFQNDRIVEHWDNLQERAAKPSPGGHTMTDGPTTPTDLDKTAANKALMQTYMDDLLQGRREKFTSYFDNGAYIQHSPLVGDDLSGLFAGLGALARQGLAVKYDKVEKIIGEGNFVLVVASGSFGGKPSAYYDLYRIQNGKIAEHWDTIDAIPPRAEWKNANGKF